MLPRAQLETIEEKFHPAAYGVMLYILVSIGRVPELYPGIKFLHLGKVALILTVLGLFISRKHALNAISGDKLFRLVIYFFVISAFSVGISIWGSFSLNFFKDNIVTIVLLSIFIMLSAINIKTIKYYSIALIISAVILSVETLRLTLTGRLSVGTSYDPNDLAQVLVTILPLVVFYLFSKNANFKFKLIILCVSGLLLTAILLTGSRGGMLGLIAVFVYLLKQLSSNKKMFLKILFIISLGGIFALSMMPSYTADRFNTLFNIESDYNLTEEGGRVAIWKRGVDRLISNPIGVGVGAFGVSESRSAGVYKAAHNIFVQSGVELGVLGLLLYILMFRRMFKDLIEINTLSRKKSSLVLEEIYLLSIVFRASIFGYLITGLFLSCAYRPLLFSLIGMTVALKLNYYFYLKQEN